MPAPAFLVSQDMKREDGPIDGCVGAVARRGLEMIRKI
jgi:hypothetical protein